MTVQTTCVLETTSTLTASAVSGAATFADLQFVRRSIDCTLTATSGTLASDTSNAFNVE